MNKVILVTGGSSGIGKAIASVLSEQGAIVYGTSRKERASESLNFNTLQMDVTRPESIASAIQQVIENEGRLDVLINNAGLGMGGPLEDTTVEEAKNIFETNFFGVHGVCRHALPHLRKTRGTIINITSIGGLVSLPYRGIYCASKFAVEGYTEALSLEASRFGVRVVIVEPGDVKTEINQNRIHTGDISRALYQKSFETVLGQITEEVNEGYDPAILGKKILQILNSKNPRLRYKVARPLQKFSLFIKYILPDRMFERMMIRHYQLDKEFENEPTNEKSTRS